MNREIDIKTSFAAHVRRTQLLAEIADLESQPLTTLLYPLALPTPATRSPSRKRLTLTPTRQMR